MKNARVLLASLCLLSAPAFASHIYLGPTVTYENFYLNDTNYQAISPRATLGFGDWYTKWIYLAAEVFGSPKDYNFRNGSEFNPLKVQYSFGGSIIPGVYLDNIVMGYLRLGATFAKFSLTDSILRGFQTGIGFDVTWTPCWHVRGEYDWARFKNLSDLGSPRSNEASLSLIYRFYLPEE